MAVKTYIVHHHYDAEKEDELTLEVGDIINVSDSSDPGWWVGEKVKDGKAGWFPSNFVNPYEESATETAPQSTEGDSAAVVADTAAPIASDESLPPKNEGPSLARVEYDYEAKESGELSLEVGRVVTILDSSDPAWWKGDLNGKIGTFPSNYVKPIDNKEEESSADKPAKFKLAAFGVKQGGLGSLFAGGVVPGLKKTGGLKKLAGVDAPVVATAGAPKRTSIDEPRSPGFTTHAPKATVPPVAEEHIPHVLQEAAPVAPAAPQEPRVPKLAKKPKVKQIKALVVYEYTAQEDDEISLIKGSSVVVTDKMGDEGWWTGRNEQGEVGNFPSDYVQEIVEENIQSPPVTPSAPAHHDEPLKSPVQTRPPVALPAIPVEPTHIEPTRATPPPLPRGSRPPSMIASPTPAHHHEARSVNDGPPLPASPPPKRMSIVSRSSSVDYSSSSLGVEPPSPTVGQPGDLSRSSTLRRPQKPIPVAPLNEADETQHHDLPVETSDTPSSNSSRNSYILPTPVSRNRSLPPLARPPSIHQAENRKSQVISPSTQLPSVPGNTEDVAKDASASLDKLEEEAEDKQEGVEVVEAPHEQIKLTQVASPETIHTEPEVHEEPVREEPVVATTGGDIEEKIEDVHQEESQDQAEARAGVIAAADIEEKEPEKPKLPEMEGSGPALSHASRPRPAKGRKPPSAPVPNTEASFVSQLEAEVKAAPIVEEKKPEPVAPAPTAERAPPPKPVKPIFQKFPTPFAGAQPAA
ncbi:SH3-domain kinase binding protein 1, partial [Entomortierella lignicola]